jgi:hypothetical protein
MKKILAMAMSILIAGSMLFLSPTTPAQAGAKPAATDQLQGSKLTFGYVDSSGQQLLGFDTKNPKRYIKAIYAPGLRTLIHYEKHQKGSESSTGRQTAYNFDQDNGERYRLPAGKMPSNASIVLAEKDTFTGHQFLTYTALTKGAFSSSTVRSIEKIKQRKIAKQSLIGQVSSDIQIGLVQFTQTGKQLPLASLVLTTPTGLVIHDFVGNKDKSSTWRVDDGGEIDASMFNVLFVTKSKSGYSLGLEWIGFEGYALKILQQEKNHFRMVLEGSRYTAPL